MNKDQNRKILLEVLNQKPSEKIPFWFMRQAGRYLPEYRKLRKEKGSFLNLVYDPIAACEVTMQPIRRFGMNGAILFSDILVIPQALGQDLRFETGEGPKLNAINSLEDIENLNVEKIDDVLSPIYDTVSRVRKNLENEGYHQTTLIGFAGAPWTVACYMINGKGSKDYQLVKNFFRDHPREFQLIIDLITQATIHYLSKQIEAGAEIIKIFDSWAGLLEEEDFDKYVIQPTKKIINAINEKYPDVPIIGFPRKSAEKAIKYVSETGVHGLALDEDVDLKWATENIDENVVLQGNLSNQLLLNGGYEMKRQVQEILDIGSKRSFIFNLGHGVVKETPVENVEKLSQIVREYRA